MFFFSGSHDETCPFGVLLVGVNRISQRRGEAKPL